MKAVPWYGLAEIDYLLNFIGRQHTAEQDKVMTGICKAYDRNVTVLPVVEVRRTGTGKNDVLPD